MEVEYLTVLPDDQDDLQSNVVYNVDTEHEYLAVLSEVQELPQSNMPCIIADSVEAEYLSIDQELQPGDMRGYVKNKYLTVLGDQDLLQREYVTLQERSKSDLQTYSTCSSATQSTAAVLEHSTDTNSHINVNTCSHTYNTHTNVNIGSPTYGMSETRQQGDASDVLYMINTDNNYSHFKNFSSDLIYSEKPSLSSNTIFKSLSLVRR
jgi:hypothetical protein